ncbi:ribosome assembly RNA-binding protein YhbY [Treponema sp. C6A8]|uniref:ribosome assembly RNA-binding protein YhbY n=1 Tax=Treponema sp. C6A8 TaxID=1410609 RepID=UPI000488B938|nr:ribosome assembly RNA-binding protein YhbY [Treponema sp. C6A8]
MIELTSKQRKELEKAAHDLQPVVIVGGAGVTEGVIKMVDSSLSAHELIKIKFNEYKDEKVELTNKLCEETDATLVRLIGNVAILFREKEDEEE